jgi:hypothetical protein
MGYSYLSKMVFAQYTGASDIGRHNYLYFIVIFMGEMGINH